MLLTPATTMRRRSPTSMSTTGGESRHTRLEQSVLHVQTSRKGGYPIKPLTCPTALWQYPLRRATTSSCSAKGMSLCEVKSGYRSMSRGTFCNTGLSCGNRRYRRRPRKDNR